MIRAVPGRGTELLSQHASFRIDGMDTMVMGLPPPEVYDMQSYRNFGLAHSVREIFVSVSQWVYLFMALFLNSVPIALA